MAWIRLLVLRAGRLIVKPQRGGVPLGHARVKHPFELATAGFAVAQGQGPKGPSRGSECPRGSTPDLHSALLCGDFSPFYGRGSARVDALRHAEEYEDLGLEVGEFGREDVHVATVSLQDMSLGQGEEAEDLFRCRPLRAALFGIQGQILDPFPVHGPA